jgi:hypothetical protein
LDLAIATRAVAARKNAVLEKFMAYKGSVSQRMSIPRR